MPYRNKTHCERIKNRAVNDKVYDEQRKGTIARTIRAGARWRRFSKVLLRKYPLCRDPFGTHKRLGEVVPSQDVHHIIPLAQNPALAYTLGNCATLCRGCHNRIGAMERRGEDCRMLFYEDSTE